MWVTGCPSGQWREAARGGRNPGGFTLVELLAAMTIVGIVIAVSVPASVRFYDSMQYRQTIRDVVATLSAARVRALSSGRPMDVSLDPRSNEISFDGKTLGLPKDLTVGLRTAAEVNRRGIGVVRFYPEGGSSGGDIDIVRPSGSGTRITVDWLAGRVSHARFEQQ